MPMSMPQRGQVASMCACHCGHSHCLQAGRPCLNLGRIFTQAYKTIVMRLITLVNGKTFVCSRIRVIKIEDI